MKIKQIQVNKKIINLLYKQMLNLQLVEKERARLYKNQLRRQLQQKQQMRKNHSMQLRSKDQLQLQEKMQLANQVMKSQKQRNQYISNQLKQDNMLLASMKNHNKQLQQSFIQDIPLKGSNIMDTLYQHNDIRGKQYKNVAKKLVQSYHQEGNLQKQLNKQVKHQQINEDMKHLQTLKNLQALRRKQYEDIKNKHSPQPKVGEIHKRLQQVNDQYRKSLESFAYNGKDILDSLKRDDSKQIYERNKRVQSQLRYQMEQKKYKQEVQKQQYIGQQPNLQKSILGSILFKDSNFDKKQYANYLMKQMNQTDLRRSSEKVENKQKLEIGSIFGGQGGPERLKMIKYIDKNLGIESDYLKNIQPGNKSSSPYRMKNLYEFNGDQSQSLMNSSTRQNSNEKIDKRHQNPQKSHTQQSIKVENRQRKTQSSTNELTVRLNSSQLGQHQQQTPRSYLGYDLIKGSPMRYEY